MSTADFTHLHLHTQYSFLDGAIRIKDLIRRVSELGMRQVAVTDHGNMFGAVDFYQQATRAGIKPILGIEAYITGNSKHTDRVRENYHIVLLAENNEGYDNLKKLSSRAFTHGKFYHPRIDKDLLYEHRKGIIASTACLGGEVGKKCARDDVDGARQAIRDYKRIFDKDHFFLEVQPNGLELQNKVNAQLAQLARDEEVRLIATNDCHYVTKDQHDAQNILMAIRQQKSWDDPTLHKHENNSFYIRSGQEMYDLLQAEYAEGFESACEIGRRCKVEIDLGNVYLPPFPCPDRFTDEPDYLRHLAFEGLNRRFKEIPHSVDRDEYLARLEHELKVIIDMGFPGYFLIVQDFINWAKNKRIRVGPGRGSGAGSLVAFALRITDVDPIPYNLLFERFLNPERVSMPDFDVDFMQERRGEVINYVGERYGSAKVGQIATYSALNPKSAIKDVARVLDVPFSEINELTKPMPILVDGKKPSLEQSLDFAPKLRQKAREDSTYARILQTAGTLEGLYRQAGMHAGGIVIGEKDLVEYVPIFSGNNGENITQFDKDKVEAAGLVKFDFLGLKTLDVIAHAEDLVNRRIALENKESTESKIKLRKNHPHMKNCESDQISQLEIELLQPEDKAIYKLISSGDTLGIFQVESSGFQELCRKLKPDCFEDIVAAVALYRPGPMQSGMVDDFIDRKHGRKKVVYPHEKLETVLKPTYGTFVYQEQIMQSAQVLAGYTLGSADILRRAMGKKNFDEMKRQREGFVEGASKNGVSYSQAGLIFDTIEKFAGYGFNKSHSAAYALITYQTAYLKCYYPIEFMTALLTTASGSTDDIVKYIREARENNISVLAPCINQSEKKFTVEYKKGYLENPRGKNTYGSIRFGLEAVKGLGTAALETILSTREEKGPYGSLYQLCERVPLQKMNKKVLEALVCSGALDCFERTRKQLFETLETAIKSSQKLHRDASVGQTNMFTIFSPSQKIGEGEVYAEEGKWPQSEMLRRERASIGFYLSGHPLSRYENDSKKLGAVPCNSLAFSKHHEQVSIVGIVTELKERPLKSGKGRWAVISVQDSYGHAEVLCFSKAYDKAEALLKSDEPLLLRGKVIIDDVSEEGQQITSKMRLEEAEMLSTVQISRTKFVEISLLLNSNTDNQSLVGKIKQVVTSHRGDKPLKLNITVPEKYTVTASCDNSFSVTPNDQLIHELEEISGVVQAIRA